MLGTLVVAAAVGQGCYSPGNCVKSTVDQNWYKWDTSPHTQSFLFDLACDDTGLGATSFGPGAIDAARNVGNSIAFPDDSWNIVYDPASAGETSQDKEAVYLYQGTDTLANFKAVLCACTPCQDAPTGVSEADKAAAARSAAVAALGPTVTWTKRTSAGKKDWYPVASDATGLRLAAGVDDGHIHTSTNGGESWTKQAASGVETWQMIDSSDSGTRIVASGNDENVHVSTDGGLSWTQATVAADAKDVFAVSCTRDCRTIAISRYDTGGELSTDGGTSWTPVNYPGGSEPSYNIAVSADTDANGVPLASIGITKPGFEGHPFSSVLVKTGTADWRRVSVDDNANFWTGAVNQDGSVMLAGASRNDDDGKSNGVYVSYNGGISWSKRILFPSAEKFDCNYVAMDDSGATMAAYVSGATVGVFVSLDGGASWAKQPLDVSHDVTPLSVAVSGDGTRIVVTAFGGYIYTGVVNPLPGPAGSDWLAWEYQTAMGVALGATAAGVPIGAAALREK